MNEADCKSRLGVAVRERCPNAIWMRLEDKLLVGVPDISLTYAGVGTWWEAKYANPSFKSRKVQELMMKQLARQSSGAFYIIFCEDTRKGSRQVRIYHPDQITAWEDPTQAVRVFFPRAANWFPFADIADFMLTYHER